MPAERRSGPRGVLALRGTTIGDVAVAAFVICAISGVLLVPSYDAHDGRASIAEWLLTNPGAVFLRNVHYWTAQVFLAGTVLHLWDHLRVATERRVPGGIWLRVVLSLPVIGFLMLSGFMLRGDSDALQAHRILGEVITQLPVIGSLAAMFLFGTGEQLHVVYLQHAATATIIVWLAIAEHARRLWPRTAATGVVVAAVSALALVLSPGLHDGLDLRMKGPWYFLGMQEILHWTSQPLVAVAVGVAGIALVWLLPRLPFLWARRAKQGLLLAFGTYALLCGVGLFLRGENWRLQPNWPNSTADLRPGLIVQATAPDSQVLSAKLPVVMGRAEGCLVCHAGVTGLGDSHRPESIGCASCHAGDVYSLDMKRAHTGMIRVPGNLSDAPRTCGQAGCHATVIPRVERSIMTTFAGVIEVDRRVFGERTTSTPSMPPHVRDLGTSAADTHLRQLCASCHLGQRKDAWGAIGEESRGGGCNACHLVYAADAKAQLANYLGTPPTARTAIPRVHPMLTVNVDNGHCFGCHSRSGRISTNYEGWHELHDAPPAAKLAADAAASPHQYRQLDDGRFFTRVTPDVHQARGLDCIDCHTANEVMGKGTVVAHKHEQVQVRCEDCHTRTFPLAAEPSTDPEVQKLMRLRQWTLAPGQHLAATSTGDPLVSVIVDADLKGRMLHKRTGQSSELRPPLAVCTRGKGHARLSCNSCHTPWAPRCASCHTSFDRAAEGFDHISQKTVKGAWQESSDAFEAAAPTLGVRTDSRDTAHRDGTIDTFVPGMILDIDRNRGAGPPDPVFRRLYARTFSHTITRASRSCESCHNDPVALGYGRGVLRYEVTGDAGRWTFTPEHSRSPADGLPADAWIGFLQSRSGMVSTRDDVRPFTVDEQRRILRTGACLTCHAGASPVMQQAIVDFDSVYARRTRRCVVPIDR